MIPRHLYLGLCVLGTVLPVSQFLPFLRQHGLNVREFAAQLFATPVSSFFGLDVIVSSMVLWAFVAIDGRRNGLTHLWAPIVANLAVGVSLGLPLFLYMREARLGGDTSLNRNRGGHAKNRIAGRCPGCAPDRRLPRRDQGGRRSLGA
jgi:hypothetical protein